MHYGIELKNTHGTTILREGETPLQYYGKISHAGTLNRILNIPSYVPCAFFHRGGIPIDIEIKNGYYNLIGNSGVGFTNTYVFMSSKYIPKGSGYGIEVYGGNSELMFQGHRPLMSPSDISTITPNYGMMPNNYITKYTQTHIFNFTPAIPAQSKYIMRLGAQAGAMAPVMRLTIGTNGKSIGCWWKEMGRFQWPIAYGSLLAQNVPVIDSSYYDQFSSYGNFS